VVEEEVGDVGEGFKGREGERNGSFMLLAYLYPETLAQAKFGSPGRVDPAQILLLRLKNHIAYSRCYIVNPNGHNV